MQHEHFKHQRDFHYEDRTKMEDQERKDARDEVVDQLSDDNDELFELHESNEKHAEQQKGDNEQFFEAVLESVINEEYEAVAAEISAAQQQEREADVRKELLAEQRHVPSDVVVHIADRCSALDHIKADMMMVAGVPQQVLEQLFKIFKDSQDELLAEGITLEKRGKTDMLIKFPSQLSALNFLKFLSHIQQGVAPDVHNKHLCTPFFGLTLIAEVGKAIANDASELAHKLNPFKMRLNHL